MKIHYNNCTIELTKAEAKAASEYGSKMYNELLKIRADFPTYQVVVRTTNTSKRKSADTLKGLTYDYMESYIIAHGGAEQLADFNEFREKDKMSGKAVISYGEIKSWFLTQFPEILNKRKELDRKIAAAPAAKEVA